MPYGLSRGPVAAVRDTLRSLRSATLDEVVLESGLEREQVAAGLDHWAALGRLTVRHARTLTGLAKPTAAPAPHGAAGCGAGCCGRDAAPASGLATVYTWTDE